MGATYSNLVVVGRSTQAVVAAMGDRAGFVSDEVGEFVAVFPREDLASVVAGTVAALSAALSALVLGFEVDDSDVLRCSIRSDDEAASVEVPMRSRPRGLRRRRSDGDVSAYAGAVERAGLGARDAVRSVLDATYVFADDRHEDLLGTLGLPGYLRGVGHRYLLADGPGIVPIRLHRVGPG